MEKRLNEIDVELRELMTEIETADEERMTALEERVSALETEKRGIEEDIETRKKEEAALEEVKRHESEVKKIEERKEKTMEIRNTKEYIDAFANYIKSGDDKECRALLTENVNGSIPVPEFVYDVVTQAWEKNDVLGRVRKAYLKGNVKVSAEISASPAVIHEEGGDPITEEELVLAIIELLPETLKKWVGLSDETLDLNGEALLRYVYDEITYQIFLALTGLIVGSITAAPTTATGSEVSVAHYTVTEAGLTDIVGASGLLGGGVANPVVITSRANYATYRSLAMSANYAVDPFDGMEVVFVPDSMLPSGANTVLAIVGDLNAILCNFPNGDDVQIKYDEFTLATEDIVRVIGRMPVGVGLVVDKAFSVIIEEK